ncbi:unnamed protein product [Adineta steineri]|uniref:Fibrinogen C-terminal domain-containing protein n=1 Tax=Adineta steineri TaxID=433720 RepID=A0A814V8G5_9BILA|nr:unnamed protein product [Adineta steineri]CAF3792116.1 unnamed protein product [Adineta steineri]
MSVFSLLFSFYLIIYYANTAPASNENGSNNGLSANGKVNDDPMCKMDEGRIEIPLNGRIRLGTNPCKVCTCTLTGFACEDQCETIPGSTSIGAPGEIGTTTTTGSTSPTPGQIMISPSFPPSPMPNTNGNTPASSTPSTPINRNSNTEDSTTNYANGACTRLGACGREYAYADCSEVYASGKRTTGIYEIWPRTSPKPFRVLCDMDTDGGGWTVIQHRGDYYPQTNFYQTWSTYKRGFGDLTRDFYLGNEKIYLIGEQDEYRIHFDLEDFNNQTRFAEYEWFFITNEQTKYTLNVGDYVKTSNAGDSFSHARGMRFTTRDQDNDVSSTKQCAENFFSGWWHKDCTVVNLNGLYIRGNDTSATGIFWSGWLGGNYSLKSCSIKIRPNTFSSDMFL